MFSRSLSFQLSRARKFFWEKVKLLRLAELSWEFHLHSKRLRCLIALAFFLPAFVRAQTSATLTDLGATAPTPGPSDISQLSTSGQGNFPDTLNYYTDNESSHGAGEPGQTFRTGAIGTSYLFTALAIKTGGGTTSGTGNAQNYLLHIYAVTNGNATVIATFIASNFAFTDGDWLQWSGFNLSLATNANYAFSFGKASSAVAGWEAMGNANGNLYANGELGLLPVGGGAITFGGSHNYDAVFNIGLTASGSGTATVTNNPATAIQADAATLNGTVLSIGANVPQVKFFYGTNDGGNNSAAWSNSVAVGLQTGAFSQTVSGLKTNTTYYFTAQASNNVGVSWASPSQSFTTLVPSLPSVTNLPASAVSATFATLNGQVLSTGNENPFVRVYFGANDGGANANSWSNQVSIGTQGGIFSAQAAGLLPNTTYFFNVSASNSAGIVWATSSKSFTTILPTRVNVLTFHYDNSRQGANTNETLLTPANVNATNFGKLFSYAVDSYVYAQPLIVNGVNIPGKGTRNVLYVATEHDSVYALDADTNSDANGGLLWKTNIGIAAISPSTEYGTRYHAQGNTDVVPEEGITGTPVIDLTSGTVYLDTFTREVVAGVSTNYFHRIHALNITNGYEQPFSPVVVTASVPGTGVGGNGTTVTFKAIQHMQRPAMTLAGGILYVCYGSHGDADPYHGWVMGFNPTNLVQLTNYIFNTTPNATVAAFGASAGEGALWMGGNGLCVDANTNLYFETGNGSFSANTNGGDYSDSFVKLSTTANKLSVGDYFTPFNQASLAAADTDLGSGGMMLLPDDVGSVTHPHLLVGAGKEGKIYLIDRDNMGHYQSGSDSQIVQSIGSAIGGVWGSPAYWNHRIYYQGNGDVMKAFYIANGSITTTPESHSATTYGFPGSTPMISANGTNNGIAWDTDPSAYSSSGPAVLHAYNATNLAIELYNSSQNLSRDNPGGAVKMTCPMVANGKVYVGAEYNVSVYGSAVFVATPTISPNGGTFTNSILVTISDATGGATIYYTLDGNTPTTSSALYTTPFVLTNSAGVKAIAIASGAVNSAVASASFINTASLGSGTGLRGEYFSNHTAASPFTGSPTLVRTDSTVNFDWGNGSPDPAIGADTFTVRWTGSVQPQFNETYAFSTTTDDGVRLWVNGQLIIDQWVDQAPTTVSGSIALKAQQLYSIRVEYYENGGGAVAQLAWSSPSTPQAIIPQTQLYPFTNPPPAVLLTTPANGSTFTASASVTISAEADAQYNPISAVNFYANENFLGSVSNVPYALTATGLGAGTYNLTAVAIDGSGLSTTSAPVSITVNGGSGLSYGLTSNGTVPAFLRMPATFGGSLPPLLSMTGVFSNTPGMIVSNGLVPYTPNTPLWSDGALKTRYVAVPNNGGAITPDEQIAFATNGSWTFPAGTVFVKTFELNTDTTNPNVRHRLETRLLVRDINGAVYGVTYKWRADNSDADLLSNSLLEDIVITNASGVSTQTWYYPSPSDCLQCHTPVANYVLGVNTRQLNGNQTYSTGITDNQLRTLNRLGLFNPAFDESKIGTFAKLSSLTNTSASFEERARSYLDANCAQCHQPGGPGITFDARYDTPLANQNLINGALDSDGQAMIKPRDIWRSEIRQRMNTTNGTIRMPPLGRLLIDSNAVAVLEGWINSLPGTPALAPVTITPNGGNFFNQVGITMQPPDTKAAIYFTLDGTSPTTNSFLYSGLFTLSSNATVTASAFETNYINSLPVNALFFVQPVQFTGENFSNGTFQLNFLGAIGSNYVLQASTNLMDWVPIVTNPATTNLIQFSDPRATNYPTRFYRVLQR